MNYSIPTFPENITDYAPWVAKYGLRAPYGECQCGCGQPAQIAPKNSRYGGYMKGHPRAFLHGHVARTGMNIKFRPLEERFWKRVDKNGPNGCWIWVGGGHGNGYGIFHNGKEHWYAHRMSWVLHHGPIPKGMEICHDCPGGDNRACVNPDHLFLGTHADNMADAWAKGVVSLPTNGGKKGETHSHAKLSNEDVLKIRQMRAEGVGQKEIALRFNVAPKTIGGITSRRSWTHLP